MSDDLTRTVYDAKAADYAELTTRDTPSPAMGAFLAAVPSRGKLLDLGCGPGHHAAHMAGEGHQVDAWDISAEMVTLAARHEGVTARQASFDDLEAEEIYDGIWASFSLLHAAPDHLNTHLAQIARALKPSGVFHIGMKTGEGTKRDTLGRRYTYVTPDGLTQDLAELGLTALSTHQGRSTGLDGVEAAWVMILARKS